MERERDLLKKVSKCFSELESRGKFTGSPYQGQTQGPPSKGAAPRANSKAAVPLTLLTVRRGIVLMLDLARRAYAAAAMV